VNTILEDNFIGRDDAQDVDCALDEDDEEEEEVLLIRNNSRRNRGSDISMQALSALVSL
jgi:hypothetical protein